MPWMRFIAQIQSLLNTIYLYHIETKRERLQYLLEQNQANAILKAAQPIERLKYRSIWRLSQDGYVSRLFGRGLSRELPNHIRIAEEEFLKENWALDDAAAESLHESRKEAFTYMAGNVPHGLPGKLTLKPGKSVESFVSWKNNDNVTRRIEFLEKNQETSKAYGKYWLVLADSYFENGNYDKCLNCIEIYESLHIDTFRKDHDLAKALSKAVLAAQEEYSGVKYNT